MPMIINKYYLQVEYSCLHFGVLEFYQGSLYPFSTVLERVFITPLTSTFIVPTAELVSRYMWTLSIKQYIHFLCTIVKYICLIKMKTRNHFPFRSTSFYLWFCPINVYW